MNIRDVISSVVARGGAAVLALATGIVVARLLGPTGQGYYFFVVTFSATIVQFGHLGVHSSNTYYVAGDSSSASRLLVNSLWISTIGGGILALIAMLVISITGFWGNIPWFYLTLGALMVPARLMFLLGTSMLLGLGRLSTFNRLIGLNYLIVLVAVVIAGFSKANVAGFLVATSIAWIVSVVAVLVSAREWLIGSFGFDFLIFQSGLGYASKAYVLSILSYLVIRGNVFVLQHAAGPLEVGYYSIAAQCGDAMSLIPTTIAMILFPDLVKDSWSRLKKTYKAAIQMSILMGVVCITCAIVARPLVQHLFGALYAPVVPILLWSLPGVFFYSLTSLFSQYLGSVGFPKSLLAVWVGVAILQFGLGIILIPALGGRGAAMALSCAFATAFVAEFLLIRRVPSSTPELSQSIATAAKGAASA